MVELVLHIFIRVARTWSARGIVLVSHVVNWRKIAGG